MPRRWNERITQQWCQTKQFQWRTCSVSARLAVSSGQCHTLPLSQWSGGRQVDGMDVWICFGGRRQRINGRQQATSGFHRNYLLEASAVLAEAGGGGKITRERQ